MRPVLAAILLCLASAATHAVDAQTDASGDKRPVTHQDLWEMRRLGTPVLSPDGTRAVVQVTEPAYEEEGTVTDLWLIDVTGQHSPRRLTSDPGPEHDPAWSPDGARLAFAAKRGDEDVSQIYIIDMTRPGEALKITRVSTGAGVPRWSPDGERIAFESRVYPAAADDEANAKEKTRREELGYNASAYDIFPIRQWDRWRDDLQTRLFVQEATAGAEARDLLVGTEIVAGLGYGGVPSLSGESLVAQWTPDSRGLVFSATTNLDEAARAPTRYHLFHVAADGGSPTALTTGDDFSCHSARFSPDGRNLYCLYVPVNDAAYNQTELARYEWPGSGDPSDFSPDATLLTDGLDREIREFAIGNDAEQVYLTAMDHGRVRMYRANADGSGPVTPLNPESGGVYAGPAVAGGSLVARWEDAVNPAEIVRIDGGSGTHARLTEFNVERAARLDRPAFLEFWFESRRGRQIHSFVTLPPGFDEDRRYPVITLIHGGPHASSLDADHIRWSAHLLAAPGYVVIQTDYTGSLGYGEAFAQAIDGDPLKTPADEINEAVDEAIRRYPFIDPDRQAAAGASYGGHLVNWLQGTTRRYRTLIGHAGLVSLEGQWSTSDAIYHRELRNGGPPWGDSPVWEEQSPASYAANFATPMLLTIGEKDYRVPVNQTIAMWTYLKRNDVPGRLLVFHDANHWIMNGAEARYFWSEVHGWLARYLDEPGMIRAAGSRWTGD